MPKGAKATAFWHTHGGDDPDYDSESFSNYTDPVTKTKTGDIPYADYYEIDAYVATPSGVFKHYSTVTGKVRELGTF